MLHTARPQRRGDREVTSVTTAGPAAPPRARPAGGQDMASGNRACPEASAGTRVHGDQSHCRKLEPPGACV